MDEVSKMMKEVYEAVEEEGRRDVFKAGYFTALGDIIKCCTSLADKIESDLPSGVDTEH